MRVLLDNPLVNAENLECMKCCISIAQTYHPHPEQMNFCQLQKIRPQQEHERGTVKSIGKY